MINKCCTCDITFREGDRVKVQVKATYHLLKSSVAFALDKNDMEAKSETLEHAEGCPE